MSNKKNLIVIFCRSLPFHGIGGMEIVAWDLARSLVKSGYNIALVTTKIPNINESLVVIEGVNIFIVENGLPGKYNSSWWDGASDLFFNKLKNKTKAIISISVAGYQVVKKLKHTDNIRCILQIHGTSLGEVSSKLKTKSVKDKITLVKNLYWFIKDLFIYSYFDYIVTVGDLVDTYVKKVPYKYLVNQEKILKIMNGIDQDIFCPSTKNRTLIRSKLGISENSPVIISCSRLHRQKGVIESLNAFIAFKKKYYDAKYIIIGDGPEKEILMDLVTSNNMDDDIIFTDSISRNEIIHYLQGADIFLFLSLRAEGEPLNMLEASSVGLPLVISKHLLKKEQSNLFPVNPHHPIDVMNSLELALKSKTRQNTSYLSTESTLSFSTNCYIKLIEEGNN